MRFHLPHPGCWRRGRLRLQLSSTPPPFLLLSLFSLSSTSRLPSSVTSSSPSTPTMVAASMRPSRWLERSSPRSSRALSRRDRIPPADARRIWACTAALRAEIVVDVSQGVESVAHELVHPIVQTDFPRHPRGSARDWARSSRERASPPTEASTAWQAGGFPAFDRPSPRRRKATRSAWRASFPSKTVGSSRDGARRRRQTPRARPHSARSWAKAPRTRRQSGEPG